MNKHNLICCLYVLWAAISTCDAQDSVRLTTNSNHRRLLFREDFGQPLDTALWRVELEPSPSSFVKTDHHKMVVQTGAGVTIWYKPILTGNIFITYSRKVVTNGGSFDRVSDLNQFFMASEPDKFALKTRNGNLDAYNSLQLYYVGMGGNANTTTRFRKYDGKGNRILLSEYTDAAHLLLANKTYQISIMIKNGLVSYWVDNKLYFSYQDKQPLKQGYFGFRSTQSHQEISNVKIYQLF